ncbi:hypothetical protein EVAR_48424_1 [Eumeta japonica]|uniref:Uncharacterized protein n=1 Tax=Eumeta variegata TaxID=151549 RepID=A0A4C1XPH6_EUMVA|nr:hypothetical protein EVAR_48424_1 [Eumeta japonica]
MSNHMRDDQRKSVMVRVITSVASEAKVETELWAESQRAEEAPAPDTALIKCKHSRRSGRCAQIHRLYYFYAPARERSAARSLHLSDFKHIVAFKGRDDRFHITVTLTGETVFSGKSHREITAPRNSYTEHITRVTSVSARAARAGGPRRAPLKSNKNHINRGREPRVITATARAPPRTLRSRRGLSVQIISKIPLATLVTRW